MFIFNITVHKLFHYYENKQIFEENKKNSCALVEKENEMT